MGKKSENKTEILSFGTSFLSLEPALMIHMMSAIMVFMVVQDYMIGQACRVNLGYSEEVCTALEDRKTDGLTSENEILQKLISSAMMVRTMVENLFPMVLVFLVGAWSDTYGRKRPILLVVVSFILQNIALLASTYFERIAGVWTIAILSSLIVSLSGNQACFMMAAFSYVSGHTKIENHTKRQGMTHVCLILGITLGLAGGGMIKNAIGVKGAFLAGIAMEAFSLLYILFMLREDVGNYWDGVNELLDFQHIKNSINAVFKKRVGVSSWQLWGLLLSHAFILTPTFGELGVLYLFGRLQFGWGSSDYGNFMAYRTIIGFTSNFVSMILLTSILKLTDPGVGIVCCFSAALTSISFAFAPSSQAMYAGGLISLLAGTMMVVPRSMISKMIPRHELGKVNSAIASLEALTPLLAGPLYTYVYTNYVTVLPGAFFLLSAGSMMFPIFVFACILYTRRSEGGFKTD